MQTSLLLDVNRKKVSVQSIVIAHGGGLVMTMVIVLVLVMYGYGDVDAANGDGRTW